MWKLRHVHFPCRESLTCAWFLLRLASARLDFLLHQSDWPLGDHLAPAFKVQRAHGHGRYTRQRDERAPAITQMDSNFNHLCSARTKRKPASTALHVITIERTIGEHGSMISAGFISLVLHRGYRSRRRKRCLGCMFAGRTGRDLWVCGLWLLCCRASWPGVRHEGPAYLPALPSRAA